MFRHALAVARQIPPDYAEQVEPEARELPSSAPVRVTLYDTTTGLKRLASVTVARERARDIGQILWGAKVPEYRQVKQRFVVRIEASRRGSVRRRAGA